MQIIFLKEKRNYHVIKYIQNSQNHKMQTKKIGYRLKHYLTL